MSKIILKSILNYISYSPDKFRWTDEHTHTHIKNCRSISHSPQSGSTKNNFNCRSKLLGCSTFSLLFICFEIHFSATLGYEKQVVIFRVTILLYHTMQHFDAPKIYSCGNIVRKGEIACNKQFLLFSQFFLPYMALIFHLQCNLKCCLQFVSI